MVAGGGFEPPTFGYEPAKVALPYSRLLPCSTADEVARVTFMTSSPIHSRVLPENTAPFTAARAMQNDMPRCVGLHGRVRVLVALVLGGE